MQRRARNASRNAGRCGGGLGARVDERRARRRGVDHGGTSPQRSGSARRAPSRARAHREHVLARRDVVARRAGSAAASSPKRSASASGVEVSENRPHIGRTESTDSGKRTAPSCERAAGSRDRQRARIRARNRPPDARGFRARAAFPLRAHASCTSAALDFREVPAYAPRSPCARHSPPSRSPPATVARLLGDPQPRERDIDRAPVVNHGAGATIIYPGQSAPPHPGNYHPREAGYGQGVMAPARAAAQRPDRPGRARLARRP